MVKEALSLLVDKYSDKTNWPSWDTLAKTLSKRFGTVRSTLNFVMITLVEATPIIAVVATFFWMIQKS